MIADALPLDLLRSETITVYGTPTTQGNKTAILTGLVPEPRSRARCPRCKTPLRGLFSMVEGRRDKSRKAFKAWRAAVTGAATLAIAGREPMTGDLVLVLVVTVARPAGHYGTGRNAGKVKPAYLRARPSVRPDGGKYQRAIEDALTDAGVWLDDAQVVEWHGRKLYAGGTGALDRPGAVIEVQQI